MEKELEQTLIDILKGLDYLEDGDPFEYHASRYDNRDSFDIQTLAKMWNVGKYANDPEHFYNEFSDVISDGWYEEERYIRDQVYDAIQEAGVEITPEVEDWVMDSITFYPPYDDYLGDTYDFEIFINTGDDNTEYTDNPTDDTIADLNEVEDLPDTASLVWLAGTQGYSKEDLFNALVNEDFKGSRFLRSVYEECINTWGRAQLVFLVEMSIKRVIEGGPYNVPKNVMCGLVDTYAGAGSVLGIELEKPITIPKDVISSVDFDQTVDYYYSVNDIYGGVDHTEI